MKITKADEAKARKIAKDLEEIWMRIASLRMDTGVEFVNQMAMVDELRSTLEATAEEWSKIAGKKS